MLKGIPPILSPELLKTLCEMGHSDRLVIADANFPAMSVGQPGRIIRCDGHGIPELLDAILKVIPLDSYATQPVSLMRPVQGDPAVPPIWNRYKEIILHHDARDESLIGYLERFEFYEEARQCYAVLATGETALYGNLILQKGVIGI